jgi:hypothetical protein
MFMSNSKRKSVFFVSSVLVLIGLIAMEFGNMGRARNNSLGAKAIGDPIYVLQGTDERGSSDGTGYVLRSPETLPAGRYRR